MFNLFGKNVPEIDAAEVKKAIDEKKNFILLDVRTQLEYEKNHIQNSINLSVENFQNKSKVAELVPDKDATVYIYCLSGNRSATAAQAMIANGYTNVFSMKSGILAWRARSYQLV
jgi:phage shock protein E